LDYLLTTAERSIPNLIQDTTSFLNILNNLPPVPNNVILFTIDVTSLCTVLPHEMVKTYVTKMHQHTLKDWKQHTPDIKPIPSTYIENIITTILNQTFFKFNNNTYTQNHGITMGAPSSVKLDNITLHLHLLDILASYTGPSTSQLLRYIDDIF